MNAQLRHLVARLAVGSLLLTLVAAPPVAAQSSGWTAGPQAILDNTYDGYIDQPAGGATVPGAGQFLVTGWFVDKTAQGWAGADDIQIFLGTMGGGGTMLARAQIAQNRPDVGTALGNPYWAASGFSAVVNGASVPAGNQTLTVYAHTPGKGWWYKQVNVTGGGSGSGSVAPPGQATGAPPELTVRAPTEGQNVSTQTDFTIRGEVNDPGVGARGIDRVQVYLNGEREDGTHLGDATIEGDGSWSLTFEPTDYNAQHSNLFVYAHSRTTGKETVVIRGFNIVDRDV
jgi:Bacterial Ig domain